MGYANPASILAMTLVVLLVWAGIEDARARTIANWKNAAVALLAPGWWWATGVAAWPDVAIQIAVALGAFALFCTAFRFGMMGGGDVKLIGALALWLPLQPLLAMLMVMSVAGGVVTIAMMVDRAVRKPAGVLEVPYGVAIAVAGLLAIHQPLLNQFPR